MFGDNFWKFKLNFQFIKLENKKKWISAISFIQLLWGNEPIISLRNAFWGLKTWLTRQPKILTKRSWEKSYPSGMQKLTLKLLSQRIRKTFSLSSLPLQRKDLYHVRYGKSYSSAIEKNVGGVFFCRKWQTARRWCR